MVDLREVVAAGTLVVRRSTFVVLVVMLAVGVVVVRRTTFVVLVDMLAVVGVVAACLPVDVRAVVVPAPPVGGCV